MLRSSHVLMFTALLGAISVCAHAQAQAQTSCKVDDDCAKGFTCALNGGTDCAKPEPACPPDDPKCALPADDGCKPSEPTGSCVPGADCKTDADCSDDMVCYTSESTACSGGGAAGCASGDPKDCPQPKPEPEQCTTTTSSRCAPKWTVPCKQASDCGDQFTCEPDPDECAVSGSDSGSSGSSTPGSSGAADAGSSGDFAAPIPAQDGGSGSKRAPDLDAGTPPPAPVCTPSTTNHCEPKQITCTAGGSECPSSWTCALNPVASGGAPACFIPADTDGGTSGCIGNPVPPPAEMPETTGFCEPPYWTNFGLGSDDKGTETSGGVGSAGNGSTPPRASGDDGGVTNSKSAHDASSTAKDNSNCSVVRVRGTSGNTAPWLALFTLAAVATAARKRRRIG